MYYRICSCKLQYTCRQRFQPYSSMGVFAPFRAVGRFSQTCLRGYIRLFGLGGGQVLSREFLQTLLCLFTQLSVSCCFATTNTPSPPYIHTRRLENFYRLCCAYSHSSLFPAVLQQQTLLPPLYTHTCAHLQAHLHAHKQTNARKYTHASTHAHTHTHTYTHTHKHTHTHNTNTHTHTHSTHIHTQHKYTHTAAVVGQAVGQGGSNWQPCFTYLFGKLYM